MYTKIRTTARSPYTHPRSTYIRVVHIAHRTKGNRTKQNNAQACN